MPKPRTFQFSLLTLLLLSAAVAIWVANWRLRVSSEQYRAQLPALRNLARELYVDDPSHYAVVSPQQTWMDDYRWRVYVPPGSAAELKLQLTDVAPQARGKPVATAPLSSGSHEIELIYNRGDTDWTIRVIVDGQIAIAKTMPKEWNHGRGSRGADCVGSLQDHASLPFNLYRCRFRMPTGPKGSFQIPNGPGDGILLWIGEPSLDD